MTNRATPLAALTLMLVSLAAPSMAQNQSQIAQVRAGSSCPGCNLFQGDFTYMEKAGLNLSGARLRQADMTLAVWNRVRLNGADLRDTNAYGSVMSSANFANADLTNASLVGAWLQGSNWSGAKLEGTNLSGADLSRGRGLTQSQLSQACGDSSTILPQGLTIPSC